MTLRNRLRAPNYRNLRTASALGMLLAVFTLPGCNAKPSTGQPMHGFEITVQNQGPVIHQLEVDYPNASFGRDTVDSGMTFAYAPKIIGQGPIKVAFTDQNGKTHSAAGPVVQEGMQKNLVISIGERGDIAFQDLPARTR